MSYKSISVKEEIFDDFDALKRALNKTHNELMSELLKPYQKTIKKQKTIGENTNV